MGGFTYTAAQLLSILNTSAGGNGLISMAYQVINTKLNLLCEMGTVNPAYVSAVAPYLASAETLMLGTGAIPPVGSGFLDTSATGTITSNLDALRIAYECTVHRIV